MTCLLICTQCIYTIYRYIQYKVYIYILSRLVHFMCMSVFTVYSNQEKSVFTFFICIIIFNSLKVKTSWNSYSIQYSSINNFYWTNCFVQCIFLVIMVEMVNMAKVNTPYRLFKQRDSCHVCLYLFLQLSPYSIYCEVLCSQLFWEGIVVVWDCSYSFYFFVLQ